MEQAGSGRSCEKSDLEYPFNLPAVPVSSTFKIRLYRLYFESTKHADELHGEMKKGKAG